MVSLREMGSRIKLASMAKKFPQIQPEIMEAAVNSLTDAVLVIGPPHRGIVQVCNPAVKAIFGYSPEELVGQTTRPLHISGESYRRFGRISEPILKEHHTFEIEYPMRRKDGRVFDALVTVSVLYEDQGWVGGVVSVVRDISDHKTLERSLRQTQQRYKSIIQNLPRGMIQIFDPQLRCLFSHGEELGKEGFDPSELVGKQLGDLLAPDAVERISRHLEKALRGETVTFEGNFQEQTFLTNAAPLYDDRGRVEKILVLSVNITDRKRAEYKLQERLKEISTLYAVSNDMRRIDSQDLLCNRLVNYLTTGMQYPEISAPSIEIGGERYPSPKDHPDLDHCLAAEIRAADQAVGEIKVCYTEKKDFLLPEEHDLVKSVAESLGLWLEHRRADEKLVRRERRFRALIEHAPDGVALLGRDGKLRHLSPSTERILGYDPDQDLAQDPAELTHSEDLPNLLEALQELEKEPGGVITEQYRFRRKDGTYRWLESTISNLYHQPAVQAMVFNYRDITERLEAVEKLTEREKWFRGLIENVVDVITLVDEAGAIRYQSPSLAKSLGFEPEEQVGRQIFDYIHPEDRTEAREMLEELSSQPDATGQVKLRVKHKTGGYVHMESFGKNKLREPAIQGIVITSRDISDRIRFEQEIKRQAEEVSTLLETSLAVSSILDNTQMVKAIQGKVQQLIPFDKITVFGYQEMSKRLEVIFSAEDGQELADQIGHEIPLSESGLIGWVIQNSQAMVIDHLQTDTLPTAPRPGDRTFLSWLGVPLVIGEEVLGAITVDAAHPGVFTERHRKLLESVAAQAAISIQNQRLFQAAERRLSTVQSLRSIDLAISSSLGLDVSLEILLEQTLSTLEVDAAAVLIVDPHLQSLEYKAGKGFHTEQIQGTDLRLGEGYSGKAALSRSTIKLPHLAQADPTFQREGLVEAESFVSFFAVPLLSKGEVKGVLEVYQRTPLQPDQEWFHLLETLAGQAAIAIDSSQLFEQLQRANMELVMAYDRSLEGWAKTLELRDLETEGHSRRVTEKTVQLAREMGVNQEKLSHIYRGSLLHDIGKMGIPDRILHKEGPLDEEEWELMRTHPSLAYELLSGIPYLEEASEIPYCHHERWDGSGYPRGLKGKEIPLAARIFAVVDVWDALGSDRPYRDAWSERKIHRYLRDQAGKEFDPAVVEVFLNLLD